MQHLCNNYTDEDVNEVPQAIRDAAVAFVDLLIKATRSKQGEHALVDHIKVVPHSHLSGRDESRGVGVIYEEINQLAERIQLGYSDVANWYADMQAIEAKYGVYFECYNHWSCSVWPA